MGLAEEDLYIYWGAYLGMESEVLVSGTLQEATARIESITGRGTAKQRMDHGYLPAQAAAAGIIVRSLDSMSLLDHDETQGA